MTKEEGAPPTEEDIQVSSAGVVPSVSSLGWGPRYLTFFRVIAESEEITSSSPQLISKSPAARRNFSTPMSVLADEFLNAPASAYVDVLLAVFDALRVPRLEGATRSEASLTVTSVFGITSQDMGCDSNVDRIAVCLGALTLAVSMLGSTSLARVIPLRMRDHIRAVTASRLVPYLTTGLRQRVVSREDVLGVVAARCKSMLGTDTNSPVFIADRKRLVRVLKDLGLDDLAEGLPSPSMPLATTDTTHVDLAASPASRLESTQQAVPLAAKNTESQQQLTSTASSPSYCWNTRPQSRTTSPTMRQFSPPQPPAEPPRAKAQPGGFLVVKRHPNVMLPKQLAPEALAKPAALAVFPPQLTFDTPAAEALTALRSIDSPTIGGPTWAPPPSRVLAARSPSPPPLRGRR